MKITAFNGSPKGDRSNTHVMVASFLEGAREAGAETKNIFLVTKNIKHCMGCFTCWTKTPGRCVIKDDMAELIDTYMGSDIVVLATPLYVDHVTGIMKDFMDRKIPVVCPQFETSATGETVHVKRFKKYPSLIFMSNCGFPKQDQFALLRLYCERMRQNNKADILAEIYRSQGELLREDLPERANVIARYRDTLKKAGQEIVRNKCLAEETRKSLNEPLIPEEEYLRLVNASW